MNRCAVCPGTNKCVPPDGPPNAACRFIGEAPGSQENNKGRVFIGKAGQEVNDHYLPLAGLSRPNVWIGNAISCMPTTTAGKLDPKRTKDMELLRCCAEANLYPHLRNNPNYKVIVPMGSFACRSLDPSIDLDIQHGIPLKTEWGLTFPMYHPALGIHEPKKMLHIRTDWTRLKKLLNGTLDLAVDEYAGMEDYKVCEREEEIEEYLECNDYIPLAMDTENTQIGDPFCITFSIAPGTARLIRADQPKLLKTLQHYLDSWKAKILWHNWPHDFEIVTKMNLIFQRRLIVDTMLKVFHLGNLPQGLKALCYRELGMKMQDFDDLVSPFSSQLILKYYRLAYCEDWPKPEQQLVRDKDGKWKISKPHGFTAKLTRFFGDYEKAEGDKDLFTMWYNNWEAEHDMVEARMGPFPGKCISHVPFEKVIHYACRDADALGRLYPIILHMERRVRKTVQERWRENA